MPPVDAGAGVLAASDVIAAVVVTDDVIHTGTGSDGRRHRHLAMHLLATAERCRLDEGDDISFA
jgi:hypothetical protein